MLRGEADRAARGYGAEMTTPANEERPVDFEEVPAEEDLSTADVADRLDENPEDQPNRVDPDYARGEGDPV